MHAAAAAAGLPVAREGFADRAYNADGSLVSRRLPGALITDAEVGGRADAAAGRGGEVDHVDGAEIDWRSTPSASTPIRRVQSQLPAPSVKSSRRLGSVSGRFDHDRPPVVRVAHHQAARRVGAVGRDGRCAGSRRCRTGGSACEGHRSGGAARCRGYCAGLYNRPGHVRSSGRGASRAHDRDPTARGGRF